MKVKRGIWLVLPFLVLGITACSSRTVSSPNTGVTTTAVAMGGDAVEGILAGVSFSVHKEPG